MKQVIPIHGGTLSAAADNYGPLVSNPRATFGSAHNEVQNLWMVEGTFSNFVVVLDTAPGIGKSWTITVYKGGVSTGIVVTISGTATTGRDIANTFVTTGAGEFLTMKIVPSGTPAATEFSATIEFDSDNTGESGYSQTADPRGNATNREGLFTGNNTSGWTTRTGADDGQAANVIAADGVITAWGLAFSFDMAGAEVVAGHIWKCLEGSTTFVKQDGSGGTADTGIIFSAGEGVAIKTKSFSLPAAPGDKFLAELATTGGSPFTFRVYLGIRFVATTDGQSQMCGWTNTAPSNSNPGYRVLNGASIANWNVSENTASFAYCGVSDFSLSKLHLYAQGAPGSSKSVTIDARRNATSPVGTPTVILNDSETEDNDSSSNAIEYEDGDSLTLRSVPSGTPTTAALAWAFIQDASVFIPTNPCTGGGDVDVGTDPTEGVALAPSRTPVVWAVFHLDAGDVAVTAIPGLNDPTTYHAGRKEPRLLSIGRPRRSVSDQFGGLQTSDIDLVVADTDFRFRNLRASDYMLNRTFDVWMADDATRRAQGLARRLGHYAITSYEPLGDMTFRIRGADFIGSEVSRFFAERQLIDRRFSRTVFHMLPVELTDKVEAGYYGWIGDDSLPIVGSAVDFDETQGYGGTAVGSPLFVNFGWGSIGGTAPVDLTLGEAAGGVYGSGTTLYAMVTAIINGVESDPFPMTDGAGESLAFTGSGKKLTLTTSAVAGASAYRWYVSDAPWGHQGITPSFRITSTTVSNSAELTDGGNENVGPWPPPDTNWVGSFGTPMFVFVFARFSGGRTPEQVNAGYLKHGPWMTRPVRVGWIPVAGALEYWVVSVGIGGSYLNKWIVPNTENFLDMTVSSPPPDEVINGNFLEQGAIPVIYVGDEEILGVTLRAFFVSLGVVKINSLHGSDLATPPTRIKLSDSVYGSTIFAPGKTGWFYSTLYREFTDEDGDVRWYTMVYGISGDPVVEAAVDGTVPFTANICGFSEDSRGVDSNGDDSPTIDVLAKQLLHFLDNFGNPEDGLVWKSGPWKTSHVRNGVPVHRGSSFLDAATYAESLVPGGFLGAWKFPFDENEPFSLEGWLKAAAINHDGRWVVNEHGQLCLLMVNPNEDAVTRFSDGSVLNPIRANIPDHAIVETVPRTDTLINEVRYQFKKNYVPFETNPTPAQDELLPRQLAATRDWYSGVIVEKDTLSMSTLGGGSILLRKSLEVEFSMHRESQAPAVIVERFLARWAWPLDRVRFPASLLGCDVRPGQIVEWEHHSLPQGSPGGPRRLWLTSWEFEADVVPGQSTSLDVWLEGDDVTDLAGSPGSP